MKIKMVIDKGARIQRLCRSSIAGQFTSMTGIPGHKKSQHLIEAEAYRRVMSGEMPCTLGEFALQLLDWFRRTYPDASSITPETIENQIRETWHRRHELIRGG